MKPTNTAILNAICGFQLFCSLSVPAERLFVSLDKDKLLMVAVPYRGIQIAISSGPYFGGDMGLEREWKSAADWVAEVPKAELTAMFEKWMEGNNFAAIIGIITQVQAQHWSPADPADFH